MKFQIDLREKLASKQFSTEMHFGSVPTTQFYTDMRYHGHEVKGMFVNNICVDDGLLTPKRRQHA